MTCLSTDAEMRRRSVRVPHAHRALPTERSPGGRRPPRCRSSGRLRRPPRPTATTRAQGGGASGTWSGSVSSTPRAGRGKRPTTVRQGGCAEGRGVRPSARATIASGRGPERSARSKPERRSVPPPPISSMLSARQSGTATPAAASHETTDTRTRRPPTAREIAATPAARSPARRRSPTRTCRSPRTPAEACVAGSAAAPGDGGRAAGRTPVGVASPIPGAPAAERTAAPSNCRHGWGGWNASSAHRRSLGGPPPDPLGDPEPYRVPLLPARPVRPVGPRLPRPRPIGPFARAGGGPRESFV
jgi:hypothetical protein